MEDRKPGIDMTALGAEATLGPEGEEGSTTAPTSSGARSLERGATIGRHVVLRKIGAGGMGVVYAAYDPELDRKVALKLLLPRVGGVGKGRDRLLREAQALAKLAHPNVVVIHDVGTVGEQVWLAMEFVEGQTLKAWLRKPRAWREVLAVMRGAGEGLAAAHTAGLLHRDLKPDNVMIGDDGRVRVMDFGLARVHTERGSLDDERVDPPPVSSTTTRLTQAGAVVGTPGYMAPEQLGSAELTAAADQFAFCVTSWEALYGERPFAGDTLVAIMTNVARQQRRPPPKDRMVPSRLRRVFERGLSSEPEQRWPSMAALLAELRRLEAPRRRWPLGVAVGLTAVGIGLAQWAAVGQRCEGGPAQLDGVWDEARKPQVRDAILGTGLAYAPDTWVRVEQRLDEYARAWIAKHAEVCEATSVRQEQSAEVMELRMACLRGRRLELQQAVEVLAEADPTRVENATTLVASLPGLGRCDDVQALAAELPPPEDPEVATRVEALRERLQRARALREAGALAEELAEVEAVTAATEGLEYPPLLAEALLARGITRAWAAHYAQARVDLEQAYRLAIEHGHARVELNAAEQLVRVVGHDQERHELGLQWGITALALARTRPLEPELEANVLGAIGVLLAEQGKQGEALAHYHRALAIFERALDSALDLTRLLNDIGLLLLEQGKQDDALAHFERALAIAEHALGPAHPIVAAPLNNICTIRVQRGELDEALACLRRSLSIKEGAYGSNHPKVATTLQNLGILLAGQGRLDEALDYHRRALVIRETALGPSHTEVASSLQNMGIVLSSRGEPEAALADHQRALAILEETLGPSHPTTASALEAIGSVLASQGRLEEALVHHRRALAIREDALGPRHPHVAASLRNIGSSLQQQGKPAEARAFVERALGIVEAALGPVHPDVAPPLVILAELALDEHDEPAAREHAERAIAIGEATESPPEILAQARFALARALWPDPSQRPRALGLARAARDVYRELGKGKRAEQESVRSWLATHEASGDVEP
jgi:tetratricopeptide (TPR) repeat protein/predicted Ser/Thr protein kinase